MLIPFDSAMDHANNLSIPVNNKGCRNRPNSILGTNPVIAVQQYRKGIGILPDKLLNNSGIFT